MNLHHPCTSCQNENCECMELQLQLQGNIYKPLEGLKLIAALSKMTRKIEKNVHVRETACFLITLFITLLMLIVPLS